MEEIEESLEESRAELNPATGGTGPLLQRDYWALIRETDLSPTEIMSIVRRQFRDFAPAPFVTFRRSGAGDEPLEIGDKLRVQIRMAGETAVQVVDVDANSITLATVEGHPEAGRITFGAYPNLRNDPVFHIRSRARSSSRGHYAGFLAAGEPMQTKTWTDFIDHVAHTVGEGVVGAIVVETCEVEMTREDRELSGPTFRARG